MQLIADPYNLHCGPHTLLLTCRALLAGDYVKFNWPQAWSVSMLSWVALMYPEGLHATGSYDALLSNIRCANRSEPPHSAAYDS